VPGGAPPSADELTAEANAVIAGEVAEACRALERAAGPTAHRTALTTYLAQQLNMSEPPGKGPALPWQQDVASACTRLAPRLDGDQKEALVVALYQHAKALRVGPGPARLLLRDGVAALGLGREREEELRSRAGML
jgi:hypothetical protein